MTPPAWILKLMNNISNCFETAGEINWVWAMDEGEHEIRVFPVPFDTGNGEELDGDIRLDLGYAVAYFDPEPVVQWHLSGREEGACHIEGTVNGIEVWIWFLEAPPEDLVDDIPELPPDRDSDTDPELNLN